MKTLINLINQSRILEDSQRFYQPKTYLQKYQYLYNVALIFSKIFGIISICLALYFLVEFINAYLNVYILSWGIALILASSSEGLKQFFALISAKGYFLNEFSPINFSITIALSFLSIFCAVQGTKMIHENNDKTLSNYDASAKVQLDSIAAYFDNQIAILEADKETYIANNKVYVNKTIGNVLAYNARNTATKYEDDILKLRDHKKQELLKMSKILDKNRHLAIDNAGFNAYIFISISATIELSILLLILYVAKYRYYVKIENENMEIVPAIAPTAAPAKSLKLSNSIGFQTGKDKQRQDIINDIQAGIIDRRFLMHKHKCNVNKINQIFKELGK